MKIQREINNLGYKNKYGNPLTEDGLVGSNTLYAADTYWGNTKPKRSNNIVNNNKYKTAIIDGKEYKVEYPLATLEDLKPEDFPKIFPFREYKPIPLCQDLLYGTGTEKRM